MPNRRPGKKTQRGSPTSSDRARQTAAVGACRKATTGLVSTMVSFEESDDLSWAKDLLPARKPAATRCWSPPAPPEADWTCPSLAFTLLPSPRRAPLALALLNVPRCVLANKIHAALSALFCRMSAGTLPPAARWLTRAR